MTFRVGQKVVCVETWSPTAGQGYGDEVGPIEGQIYTIRAIGCFNSSYPGMLLCRLHEIINPVRDYAEGRDEGAFGAFRFRPIVNRKTDISTFTRMLTPTKRSVDA